MCRLQPVMSTSVCRALTGRAHPEGRDGGVRDGGAEHHGGAVGRDGHLRNGRRAGDGARHICDRRQDAVRLQGRAHTMASATAGTWRNRSVATTSNVCDERTGHGAAKTTCMPAAGQDTRTA